MRSIKMAHTYLHEGSNMIYDMLANLALKIDAG